MTRPALQERPDGCAAVGTRRSWSRATPEHRLRGARRSLRSIGPFRARHLPGVQGQSARFSPRTWRRAKAPGHVRKPTSRRLTSSGGSSCIQWLGPRCAGSGSCRRRGRSRRMDDTTQVRRCSSWLTLTVRERMLLVVDQLARLRTTRGRLLHQGCRRSVGRRQTPSSSSRTPRSRARLSSPSPPRRSRKTRC